MIDKLKEKFTRYEIARILGARSLQLAMDAPVLLKFTKEEEEEINFDSLRIAEKELDSGVLPITVKRPLPKKSEKTVKKLSKSEIKEEMVKKTEVDKKDGGAIEGEEEKDIAEQAEIMEIANPDDEVEESEEEGEMEI